MDPATIIAAGSGIANLGLGIWNAISGGSAQAKKEYNEGLANSLKAKYGGIFGQAPGPQPVDTKDVTTPSIMAGVGGALSSIQGGLDLAERKSLWDRIVPPKPEEAKAVAPDWKSPPVAGAGGFATPEALDEARKRAMIAMLGSDTTSWG